LLPYDTPQQEHWKTGSIKSEVKLKYCLFSGLLNVLISLWKIIWVYFKSIHIVDRFLINFHRFTVAEESGRKLIKFIAGKVSGKADRV